jgi:protocatechuate 3,4-dioxygenase beta subunit
MLGKMTFAGPADHDAEARGECTLRPQPWDCAVCFAPAAPAALALRVVTICAAIALSCIGRLEAATVGTPHPTISGLVLSAAGKPVVGASVDLLPLETKLERSRRILRGESTRRGLAHTTTAAGGRYLLQVADVGAYQLEVRRDGCVPMMLALRTLVEDVEAPDLVLVSDHGLEVQVALASGERVAGATVVALSASSWIWAGESLFSHLNWKGGGVPLGWQPAPRVAFAGGDGRTRLARASGERLDLYALSPGALRAERRGVSSDRVALEMVPGVPRPIAVRSRRGAPLAGAVILDQELDAPLATTDDAGAATIGGLATGVRTVEVIGPGWRSQTVTLRGNEPGAPTVVRLEEGRVLTGRVLEATTRNPLAGALVSPLSCGCIEVVDAQTVKTDERGTFRLSVDGPTSLIAAAPGHLAVIHPEAFPEDGATILLKPAVTVAGQAVDQQGHAVPGALITIDQEERVRARTGIDGRFELRGLPPGAQVKLRAEHVDYASADLALPRLVTGRSADVRLVLRRGALIVLSLVDAQGQPIVGAQGELEREADRGATDWTSTPRLLSATSDREGRLVWRHLAAGRYFLTVRAGDRIPVRLPGVAVSEKGESGDGVVDLGTVRMAPGITVEGVVVDPGGSPLASAEVRVVHENEPHEMWRVFNGPPAAISGEDGHFRITGLAAGERIDLSAAREGWSSEALDLVMPPSNPIRLAMRPLGRVKGRVVDPDGKGLAGATVVAGAKTTTSDEKGGFSLADIPAEVEGIEASLEGWLPAKLEIDLSTGKEVEAGDLTLRPASVVHGTVTDSDGNPLDLVTVEVSGSDRLRGWRDHDRVSQVTDGDGRYRMAAVEPGLRTVRATSEDGRHAGRQVEVGKGNNEVNLILARGAEVSGIVFAAEGGPLGAVSLRLSSRSGDLARETRSATDGSFEIAEVPDGTYALRAEQEGYLPATLEPVVVASAPVSGLELRLRRGGAVTGSLLGLKPGELGHVEVVAHGPTWAFRSGTIDPQGHYRVDGLAPGDWTLQARISLTGRQARGRVTMGGEGDQEALDLDFGKGLTLSGRVTKGGAALASTGVIARGQRTVAGGAAMTDQDGRYRIEGLEHGSYEVTVFAGAGRSAASRQQVSLDADQELDIDLATGGIHGRVLASADGSPIPGAVVTLSDDDNTEGLDVTADARGLFHLSEVAAGPSTARARQQGYGVARQELTVGAGEDVELTFKLERTSGLSLDVAGPRGPVESVDLAVIDGAGHLLLAGELTASEGGRVNLEGLPSGSYEVLLEAPDSAVSRFPLQVPSDPIAVQLSAPGEVDLLVPGLVQSGERAMLSLIDGAGRRLAVPGGGGVTSEWPVRFGQAQITWAPPGTWTLHVVTAAGKVLEGSVAVAPGSTIKAEIR